MWNQKIILLLENQNLLKMLHIIREDILAHCIDCRSAEINTLLFTCERCILNKYKK